jgi:hypothetical protein
LSPQKSILNQNNLDNSILSQDSNESSSEPLYLLNTNLEVNQNQLEIKSKDNLNRLQPKSFNNVNEDNYFDILNQPISPNDQDSYNIINLNNDPFYEDERFDNRSIFLENDKNIVDIEKLSNKRKSIYLDQTTITINKKKIKTDADFDSVIDYEEKKKSLALKEIFVKNNDYNIKNMDQDTTQLNKLNLKNNSNVKKTGK